MRQDRNGLRLTLMAAACGLVLSACGGGGNPGASGRLQLITFPYVGSAATLGVKTVTLKASSTSGLPVVFASATPEVCTVSGDQLTVLKGGLECSVVASQPGGTDADGVAWAAADNISQLFVVTKSPQTVTFAPPDYVIRATTSQIPLSATAGSGLPVTFTASPATVCSIQGSTLNLLGKGSCAVSAVQAGDANWDPQTTQRFIGVDPLLLADGFANPGTAQGDSSSLSTKQGGAVKVASWSSSINGISNGWESCNPSAANPNWCYHTVAADGSLTNALHMASYDGWGYGYNRIDIFTPGLTAFSSSGDTTSGLRVTTETTFVANVGVNADLFSAAKPVFVHLDLGKSNNGCHVELSAILWPKVKGGVASYGIPLTDFAVTNACGLSGVTATSFGNNVRKLPNPANNAGDAAKYQAGMQAMSNARASAFALLLTSDIARVRFRVEDQNQSKFTDGVAATDVTISGAVQVQ